MTNETSDIPKGLLEKIRKLIRLRDDKAASQGEIENATKMITQLLQKHNLDMAEVQHDPREDETGAKSWTLNGKTNRHEGSWLPYLFHVIAEFNMCTILIMAKGKHGKDDMGFIAIIGKKVNVEVVYFLVDQLRERLKVMEVNSWTGYRGMEKRNSYKRGYLKGAVDGINYALAEQEMLRKRAVREEQEENARTASAANTDRGLNWENKNMDLMIITQKEKNKEFIDNALGEDGVKSKKNKTLISQDGKENGERDGYNMQIRKGLNNKSEYLK